MGALEAAGELVTGALLGRAVEPLAGEGGEHGAICLNCGTALIGAHCHACGQSGHVHRTLSGMGHDILHGVFHFDGKLWRTLPLLVWRPGELTRRYIEGERARFVSPMALFLFSIFFMFAVFSWVGLEAPTDIEGNLNTPAAIAQARQTAVEERADAVETRDKRATSQAERKRADKRVVEADARIKTLDALAQQTGGTKVRVSSRLSGWALVDHGIEKWQKNPALMLYKLQSSVYKLSWLLIPLSLPFMWLIFCWRREYRLYDHTVFITYSIAFMSLLFVAIAVASAAGLGVGWIVAASLLIPFAHIFRQLQQAYRLRWWSALLRTFVLILLIQIVVTIFLLLLVAMGMFG